MFRTTFAVCIAASIFAAPAFASIGAPSDPSPVDSRPVVFQWIPANFHPSPGYPVTPSTAGDRVCLTTTGLGYNHIAVTSAGRLKAGHEYTAIVKYEVVKSPVFPNSFYLFARSRKLGNERDVWRNWLGEPNVPGTVTLPLSLKDADDWCIYCGCKGPSAIIVDSFTVVEGLGYTFVPASSTPVPAPAGLASRAVPTGCAPFTIAPPREPSNPVTVSAGDFGLAADPAGGRVSAEVADANTASLKAALDTCRTKKASRLTIPKGVYRFGTNMSIPFDDLSDVTIDGQGSEFIFEKLHSGVAAIDVQRDTRCVVKNLYVDWDWSVTPIATLGKVTSVTPDGLQADISFPDLTPVEIEALKTAPWMQMFPMDPATFRITTLLRIPTHPVKFDDLDEQSLRVTFKAPVPLVAGTTYCIRHLYYDMGAFRVGDIGNVLFDNVTIYSIPGMGWVTRGDASHWGFHDCRIARRPGTRRPLTTAADGFHVLESQGCLLLDGCDFAGTGDDNINIHDNVYEGVNRVDDHTLALVGNMRWRLKIAAGDTLELYHATFEPLGYLSKVVSVKFTGNDTTVVFADPMPSVVLPQTIVVNHRYDTSNVLIENCHFSTGGRGMLIGASNATIENNVYDHTRATAIQLHTEIVGTLWAEGHGGANIVIRNNQFIDENTQGKFDGAIIYASPILLAGPSAYPLFHDILIENNRFVNCPGPAVSLTSCKAVTVRGNQIENDADIVGPTAFSASIKTVWSSDIDVAGNEWLAGSPSAKSGVVYDPATTSEVTARGNELVAKLPAAGAAAGSGK